MSKPLWMILLVVMGVLVLWRGTVGGFAFWNYQRLSFSVPGQVRNVRVVPKNSKYALQVSYTYTYRGKTYAKHVLLKKPYYLNRSSAESAAKDIGEMDSLIYLDPKHPGVSSLEPQFPLKEVFYGVCLVGIFVYFVYLRSHLELLSKQM